MSENPYLTIIIPAYNEEKALTWFLPQVVSFCREKNFKLIMIDDASVDATLTMMEAEAKKWDGLLIVHHKVNKGYGGSIMDGIRQCLTPFCLTMDADGQHRLEDVEQLINTQKKMDADLVIGSRSPKSIKEETQLYRRIGKKIIHRVAELLVDKMTIQDLNSGMKLYNTELAKNYLQLCPTGMAFSEVMSLIFLQQKNLVVEVPIEVSERKDGKSTINTMTAFDTILQILNIVMVFNPLRIFFRMGLFAVLIGVIWAIPFFLRGKGLSTVALLFITTGLILMFLGLIAEQLSQIRKKGL